MNCLVLHSLHSGHKNFLKKIPYVKSRLMERFDRVDFLTTTSASETRRLSSYISSIYDVLVLVGGDGTFNNLINALAPLPKKPILGYINVGTIGDIGRNFGIPASLEKALDILIHGEIVSFDVGELNGYYFAYCAAIGRYSDIAYLTPRKKKRVLGRIAYYNEAAKEFVGKKSVHASIDADGGHYEFDTPFLLLLNGINMGGFKVNRYCSLTDGKMELYIAKKDVTNGIAPLLFNKDRVVISAKEFIVKTDEEMSWCLDGEEGPKGEAHFLTHPKMFSIIAKKGILM